MYGQERQVKVSVANKRIKKVKGQRNWSLIGNGILLITILILLTIGLQMVVTYNQYYSSEGDSSDDTYSYIYNDIIYDDAIYIHKDGDNSTGDNWVEAYITLNGAIYETSADLDEKTLIFVGLGTFDVDVAGQLNITKNVHIVGSGRDGTIFTNTHDDADYVLNVTRYFKMENCEINVTGIYSGIMVYGNNSDVRLIHMRFEGHKDAPVLLHLYSGGHGEFEDLHLDGNAAIVGIFLNGSRHNHFNNMEISGCKGGILLEGIDTDENYFSHIRVYRVSTGLQIVSGNDQHFQYMFFEHCGQSIDDVVADSSWFEISTDVMLGLVRPDDLVGIVVTTGGAGAYGVDVLIYDAELAVVDVPFYVVAIMFEPSSKERYGIRVAEGATYFYTTVCEAKAIDEINRLTLENPIIFNAQDQIYCSIMSETGGDTVDVWIEIIWLF